MISTYLQTLRLFNRNVRLYMFTIVLVGFAFDGGIYTVLLNLYLLRLGYGPEFIGVVNSVGPLAFALSSLPAGTLGSRFGSRRMMITGLLVMGLGAILLPLAELSPVGWGGAGFVLANALALVGLALYFVNAPPYLMGATSAQARTHAFSVQVAALSLAGFGGSLIGGLLPGLFAGLLGHTLIEAAPFRYPLLIAAALLLPAILALLVAEEVDEGEAGEGSTAPAAHGKRSALSTFLFTLIVVLVFIRFLQVAGLAAVATFFNVYLDQSLRLPAAQIGSLTALARLLAVPAALSTPLLTARLGNRRVVILACLGAALAMLPLALAPHWAAAGLGFSAVTALSFVRYASFSVYSLEMVPQRWRATLTGAGEMAAGLSFAVMSLGGGYIITSAGYRPLFLMAAGLSILGAFSFWAYFSLPREERIHRVMFQP